jgi:hypothetical protein
MELKTRKKFSCKFLFLIPSLIFIFIFLTSFSSSATIRFDSINHSNSDDYFQRVVKSDSGYSFLGESYYYGDLRFGTEGSETYKAFIDFWYREDLLPNNGEGLFVEKVELYFYVSYAFSGHTTEYYCRQTGHSDDMQWLATAYDYGQAGYSAETQFNGICGFGSYKELTGGNRLLTSTGWKTLDLGSVAVDEFQYLFNGSSVEGVYDYPDLFSVGFATSNDTDQWEEIRGCNHEGYKPYIIVTYNESEPEPEPEPELNLPYLKQNISNICFSKYFSMASPTTYIVDFDKMIRLEDYFGNFTGYLGNTSYPFTIFLFDSFGNLLTSVEAPEFVLGWNTYEYTSRRDAYQNDVVKFSFKLVDHNDSTYLAFYSYGDDFEGFMSISAYAENGSVTMPSFPIEVYDHCSSDLQIGGYGTISSGGNYYSSPGTGIFGAISSWFSSMFPSSSSINFRTKMTYAIVTMFVIALILILGIFSVSPSSFGRGFIYLIFFIEIFVFAYFVAIGYIPFFAVIMLSLFGILALYFKSKGGQ